MITIKRLLALPAESQSKAAHMVSTFLMDVEHGHYLAELTLPLWMIEVTLDGTIMVTGIIYSGCQVIIIVKDIWERLGTPCIVQCRWSGRLPLNASLVYPSRPWLQLNVKSSQMGACISFSLIQILVHP